MSLFDDESEPEELLGGASSAVLHRGAIDVETAERLLLVLTQELAWDQPTIRMYGKTLLQPRLVCWLGDEGASYTYSGTTHQPAAWPPELLSVKHRCEDLAGAEFNSALANLYRHGDDSVAWHADDEPELGSEPVIASVSLGAERRFHLKNRHTDETVRVDLPSGSVLVMSGRCQTDWVHQISKTKRAVGPRINLTFRRILVED